MGKIAIMFPGQGAQCVGMGSSVYQNMEEAKATFEMATEVTGIDIQKICFEENEMLSETQYTQISLLTTELALLNCFNKLGGKYDASIGLSLGEYAAVVASGALQDKDAFSVVKRRGKAMQEAYPDGGAMAAILGLEHSVVEEVCTQINGLVNVANYNCPGQVVITGECDAVEEACDRLRFEGAKHCEMLKVSGPFHCGLMESALNEVSSALEVVLLQNVEKPYVCNVTGGFVKETGEIKKLLVEQVVSPVKFMQGIETLIKDGYTCFIEMGPGRSLTSLVKRISKEVQIVHIGDYTELMNYFDAM